jgi:hypothetical protein
MQNDRVDMAKTKLVPVESAKLTVLIVIAGWKLTVNSNGKFPFLGVAAWERVHP